MPDKPVHMIELLCECSGYDCVKTIRLSAEEAQQIFNRELVVIIDGCPYGPSERYLFIEQHEGYALYQIREDLK